MLLIFLLTVTLVLSVYWVVRSMGLMAPMPRHGLAASKEPRCAACGTPTKLQCPICKAVNYCSPACQKRCWEDHKQLCNGGKSGSSSSSGGDSPDSHQAFKAALLTNGCGGKAGARGANGNSFQPPEKLLHPYNRFLALYDSEGFQGDPVGLVNTGNSCYANAVLQCLTFTPPFAALLLQQSHSQQCAESPCLFCGLTDHLEDISMHAKKLASAGSGARAKDRKVFSIKPLLAYASLPKGRGHTFSDSQEDAHEFMRHILDRMLSILLLSYGGESKVPHALQETTVIHHIFGGYLQSQVKCMECWAVSNTYESMLDLTLEVHAPEVDSLETALASFTAPEWMEGDNRYRCDSCKSYVRGRKQLSIHIPPNILTVSLKRFQVGRFGKLNKQISYPETFDLGPFISASMPWPGLRHEYHLFALVVHLDMLNSSFFGHYICYVRSSTNVWFRVDDTKVAPVQASEVLKQKAYVLFYRRAEPRPSVEEARVPVREAAGDPAAKAGRAPAGVQLQVQPEGGLKSAITSSLAGSRSQVPTGAPVVVSSAANGRREAAAANRVSSANGVVYASSPAGAGAGAVPAAMPSAPQRQGPTHAPAGPAASPSGASSNPPPASVHGALANPSSVAAANGASSNGPTASLHKPASTSDVPRANELPRMAEPANGARAPGYPGCHPGAAGTAPLVPRPVDGSALDSAVGFALGSALGSAVDAMMAQGGAVGSNSAAASSVAAASGSKASNGQHDTARAENGTILNNGAMIANHGTVMANNGTIIADHGSMANPCVMNQGASTTTENGTHHHSWGSSPPLSSQRSSPEGGSPPNGDASCNPDGYGYDKAELQRQVLLQLHYHQQQQAVLAAQQHHSQWQVMQLQQRLAQMQMEPTPLLVHAPRHFLAGPPQGVWGAMDPPAPPHQQTTPPWVEGHMMGMVPAPMGMMPPAHMAQGPMHWGMVPTPPPAGMHHPMPMMPHDVCMAQYGGPHYMNQPMPPPHGPPPPLEMHVGEAGMAYPDPAGGYAASASTQAGVYAAPPPIGQHLGAYARAPDQGPVQSNPLGQGEHVGIERMSQPQPQSHGPPPPFVEPVYWQQPLPQPQPQQPLPPTPLHPHYHHQANQATSGHPEPASQPGRHACDHGGVAAVDVTDASNARAVLEAKPHPPGVAAPDPVVGTAHAPLCGPAGGAHVEPLAATGDRISASGAASVPEATRMMPAIKSGGGRQKAGRGSGGGDGVGVRSGARKSGGESSNPLPLPSGSPATVAAAGPVTAAAAVKGGAANAEVTVATAAEMAAAEQARRVASSGATPSSSTGLQRNDFGVAVTNADDSTPGVMPGSTAIVNGSGISSGSQQPTTSKAPRRDPAASMPVAAEGPLQVPPPPPARRVTRSVTAAGAGQAQAPGGGTGTSQRDASAAHDHDSSRHAARDGGRHQGELSGDDEGGRTTGMAGVAGSENTITARRENKDVVPGGVGTNHKGEEDAAPLQNASSKVAPAASASHFCTHSPNDPLTAGHAKAGTPHPRTGMCSVSWRPEDADGSIDALTGDPLGEGRGAGSGAEARGSVCYYELLEPGGDDGKYGDHGGNGKHSGGQLLIKLRSPHLEGSADLADVEILGQCLTVTFTKGRGRLQVILPVPVLQEKFGIGKVRRREKTLQLVFEREPLSS
eukprot:jgi/Mesvir1/5848/Mv00640-RA.1